MINEVRSIQTCPPRPSMRQVLIGLLGGILGIGTIAWLTQLTNVPLLIAPFGATCVLLFAAPLRRLLNPEM